MNATEIFTNILHQIPCSPAGIGANIHLLHDEPNGVTDDLKMPNGGRINLIYSRRTFVDRRRTPYQHKFDHCLYVSVGFDTKLVDQRDYMLADDYQE